MSKPASQMKQWVKNTNQTLRRSISTTNGGTSTNGSSSARYGGGSLNQQWVHPPERLTQGRVHYTVKFLGETEVDDSKGMEMIRQAIEKIRFRLQIDRSKQGTHAAKLPKTEIQINVEGLTVVDPKTKAVMYKYPLHRISFVADDKEDKRVFSFIAKRADSDQHDCFVFISDKLAIEITLTIGEAFDLAYRKFIDQTSGDSASQRELRRLRARVKDLETENQRLVEENTRLMQEQGMHEQLASDNPLVAGRSWETFNKLTPTAEEPPKLPESPCPKGPPGVYGTGSELGAGSETVVTKTSPKVPPPPPPKRVSLNQSRTEAEKKAEEPEIPDSEFDPRAKSPPKLAVTKSLDLDSKSMTMTTEDQQNEQNLKSERKLSSAELFGQDPFDDSFFKNISNNDNRSPGLYSFGNGSNAPALSTNSNLDSPALNEEKSNALMEEMRHAFERGMGRSHEGCLTSVSSVGESTTHANTRLSVLADFDPLVTTTNGNQP